MAWQGSQSRLKKGQQRWGGIARKMAGGLLVACDENVVEWLGNGCDPGARMAIGEGWGVYQAGLQINGVALAGGGKCLSRPDRQGSFEIHCVKCQIDRTSGKVPVVMVKRRAVPVWDVSSVSIQTKFY